MKPVVCDTSPLNYLIQLGTIDLLPRLYSDVFVPAAVVSELSHPKAPAVVRAWATQAPHWLKTWRVGRTLTLGADAGEVAALSAAIEGKFENVLMDDARGRDLAIALGLNPIGTLRVLELAWEEKLIDLEAELTKLEQLNFRAHPQLFASLRRKIQGTR